VSAEFYCSIAKERNPNITIIYVSSKDVLDQARTMNDRWMEVLAFHQTEKHHCIKSFNSDKLMMSIVSSGRDFSIATIFNRATMDNSDQQESEEEEEDEEEFEIQQNRMENVENLSIGDWVFVDYDNGQKTGSSASCRISWTVFVQFIG